MKKIILTGAAGRLGGYLREPLSKFCDTLISSDIQDDIGTLFEGEEYIQADLGVLRKTCRPCVVSAVLRTLWNG